MSRNIITKCLLVLLFIMSSATAWSQVPGFVGRRNVVSLHWLLTPAFYGQRSSITASDTATVLNHSAWALEGERIIKRHLLVGASLGGFAVGDAPSFGTVGSRTRCLAVGGFVRYSYFRFTHALAPMGPYWRIDFRAIGRHSSAPGSTPEASRVPLHTGFGFATSLSAGLNSMIASRYILDLGLRFNVPFPGSIALNYYGNAGNSDAGLLSIRKMELLRLYVGFGMLL